MNRRSVEGHRGAPAKDVVERAKQRLLAEGVCMDTWRPSGGGFELLEDRGRVGDDLDRVIPFVLKKDRYARRADFVRASDRPAEQQHGERGYRDHEGTKARGETRRRNYLLFFVSLRVFVISLLHLLTARR